MSFKGPVGFARMTNLMMNVFIGIVLGATFLVVTNDLSSTPLSQLVANFLQAFVLSVCVGYALGDILPSMSLAQAACAKLNLKSGIASHLLMSLILDLINVSCILWVCMFINLFLTGGMGFVASVVVKLWPIALASGFVGIAATLKLAMTIASAASGFNPAVQGK